MALVKDEEDNAIHQPRKQALAIQPLDIESFDEHSLGVLYQIKIAKKGPVDNADDISIWHIDDSVVLHVNLQGQISIHSSEEAKKGNLSAPLSHLAINNFLNCSSLHLENNNKNIIGL